LEGVERHSAWKYLQISFWMAMNSFLSKFQLRHSRNKFSIWQSLHDFNILSLLLNDYSYRLPSVEFLSLDDNVAGVKDPWKESQNRQANINEQVTPTTPRSTDGKWRKYQRQQKKTAIRTTHLSGRLKWDLNFLMLSQNVQNMACKSSPVQHVRSNDCNESVLVTNCIQNPKLK